MVDLKLRPCEYYAIHLSPGQTLHVTVSGTGPYYNHLDIAYPGKGYDQFDWGSLNGPWLASVDGDYQVRFCDNTQGSGAYTYTIAFVVS